MSHKVLVETSVIISGSVYSARQDVTQVKHVFFDRSMKLLRFLKEHRVKRIGLVTERIEREASSVLEKAVISELGRDVEFAIKSVVLDLCWDRLSDILSILVKEPTDQKRVDELFVNIVYMYKHLMDRASLVTPTTVRAIVSEKVRGMVSSRFRKLAQPIYSAQLLRGRSQLLRLLDPSRRPSILDQFILAEAVCLYEKYNAFEPTAMFLASADTAFSPILRSDGSVLSDEITREIYDRFSVQCDWPERVAKRLAETS